MGSHVRGVVEGFQEGRRVGMPGMAMLIGYRICKYAYITHASVIHAIASPFTSNLPSQSPACRTSFQIQ